jgi:hypothetical protein
MMFSRVFGLHPMLVLKEWHQHQLKILLYSLLMSGLYIVGPFLAAALNTRVGMPWQVDLAGLVSTTLDYGSSILFLGWFIAFVWAEPGQIRVQHWFDMRGHRRLCRLNHKRAETGPNGGQRPEPL